MDGREFENSGAGLPTAHSAERHQFADLAPDPGGGGLHYCRAAPNHSIGHGLDGRALASVHHSRSVVWRPTRRWPALFAGTHRLRLAEFDFRAHERFRYEYDFHSDWVHDIRVEKILPRASVRHVPVCIAGVGRCPPEDSGPPDRFMATLDEYSGFDFMTWLEDELEKPGLDRAALRQALSDWRPWLDRRFDRKAANARLNAG